MARPIPHCARPYAVKFAGMRLIFTAWIAAIWCSVVVQGACAGVGALDAPQDAKDEIEPWMEAELVDRGLLPPHSSPQGNATKDGIDNNTSCRKSDANDPVQAALEASRDAQRRHARRTQEYIDMVNSAVTTRKARLGAIQLRMFLDKLAFGFRAKLRIRDALLAETSRLESSARDHSQRSAMALHGLTMQLTNARNDLIDMELRIESAASNLTRERAANDAAVKASKINLTTLEAENKTLFLNLSAPKRFSVLSELIWARTNATLEQTERLKRDALEPEEMRGNQQVSGVGVATDTLRRKIKSLRDILGVAKSRLKKQEGLIDAIQANATRAKETQNDTMGSWTLMLKDAGIAWGILESRLSNATELLAANRHDEEAALAMLSNRTSTLTELQSRSKSATESADKLIHTLNQSNASLSKLYVTQAEKLRKLRRVVNAYKDAAYERHERHLNVVKSLESQLTARRTALHELNQSLQRSVSAILNDSSVQNLVFGCLQSDEASALKMWLSGMATVEEKLDTSGDTDQKPVQS